MPDQETPAIDISAGLVPKDIGGIDLSAGLVPKTAAMQPGAFQTHKGGPVQNVNTPATPVDETAATQSAIHSIASNIPGGELAAGVAKGLYQTGIGLNELIAKGEHAVGIPLTEEQEHLRTGDLSPVSQAMEKGEGAGQIIGEGGEEVAEWMAGDAALKGVSKLAKISKYAPHLIDLMEKFPKTAKMLMAAGKGAAIGGTQAAVKEGDVGAAEAGAAGGALGGAAGEVVGPAVKKLGGAVGLWTTTEEDIMRAAQPGKWNTKFLQDWDLAKDRIGQEVEAEGKFKNIEDAADRISDVRRKIWSDEIMPAVDRHSTEIFDTTKAANAVRDKITPALQKNFPEDAKVLQNVADKYTSGSPLFTGDKTVGEVEKEVELYNAKLANEGYWKKTPKERAVMEKAKPEIAAWRALSDELRNSLYEHLDKAGEPGMADLKKTYGAVGNVENQIRGQVNVAGRQRPVSLKQIIGFASGQPLGIIAALGDRIYNEPSAILNRAVAKAAPGPVKKAVQAVAPAVGKAAKAAAGVVGEEAGRGTIQFTASDGSVHTVNADQLDAAKQIDPNLKVNP